MLYNIPYIFFFLTKRDYTKINILMKKRVLLQTTRAFFFYRFHSSIKCVFAYNSFNTLFHEIQYVSKYQKT